MSSEELSPMRSLLSASSNSSALLCSVSAFFVGVFNDFVLGYDVIHVNGFVGNGIIEIRDRLITHFLDCAHEACLVKINLAILAASLQQFLTEFGGAVGPFVDCLSDFVAGLGGHDETQPVLLWHLYRVLW